APHPAMDVGEVAGKDGVQDPCRNRRSEIAVQRRHGSGLDVPAKARAHDEFRTGPKSLDERGKLPKIVRTVAISHQHVLSADERERVLIGATEAALRSSEHARPSAQGKLSGLVLAAVDDEDLAANPRLGEALVAPRYELLDGELLVQRGDDD